MVNAYHVIFTAYGFWLPNDPRGSWSDFVRSWELYQHGAATKVTTRRSLASAPHDRQLRRTQKSVLKYDPVRFSEQQIACVARGFARAVRESGYELLACSIMPEHVHAVPLRHRNTAEQIMSHFKARATQQLPADGLHPLATFQEESVNVPCAWGRRGWKVFLSSDEDINRAVRYVDGNPTKQRRPRQNWDFVNPGRA